MKTVASFVILSLNYAPEPSGFAPHATALAEFLAGRGHNVSVITGFPFAPRWQRWPEYRGQLSSERVQRGVLLQRVTHFIPRHPRAAWQRALMEFTFAVSATTKALSALFKRRPRPDALLYIGAQPAIAMLTRCLAKLYRAPYFVNINDLAAQAAADVGIVKMGRVQRALERFEFAAYLPAHGATVLCRSFADALIVRGYPSRRIRLIRSPIDLNRVTPVPRTPGWRDRLGIAGDAFVVLSAGSMGLKQGITNIVEAARLGMLKNMSPTVVWVLVGDGEMRDAVKELVQRYGLGRDVRLLPFQPEDQLVSMFAAADVLVLNQLASVKDAVIPSKLLTYMAAGKPVLAAVNATSQGAEILREADGGALVEPEDPEALIRGVEALRNTPPEALAAMGARNRRYAEDHFDQEKILAEHEAFILERLAEFPRNRHSTTPELIGS